MKRLSLVAGALALTALATAGCSAGGGAATEESSTTFSISGTMGGLTFMATQNTELDAMGYLKNQFITSAVSMMGTGEGDVSAMSNQCADCAFYRVLCSAWSTPPVAAYGDVTCNNTSSGSFTVSGLPLDTDISCAVRKSTDATNFVPFANLELPASSLSGGTDVINAADNLQLAITVDPSSGSITTTVTGGDNKADDGIGSVTVDASTMTGFYNLTCPTDISDENTLKCKCFLFGDDDKDACIASNGASIPSDSKFSINLNVYEGTIQAGGLDMDDDSTADLPEGSKIYGGTIWAADNGSGSPCTALSGCTSAKSGAAEGLPTFGSAIDWTVANVEDPLTFASGAQTLVCGAGTTSVTVPANPGPTGTRTQWRDWLASLVNAYDSGGVCADAWEGCHSSVSAGSRHLDKFCVANFAWTVLGNSEVDLPRINIDWGQMCNESGCGTSTADVPVNALMIEGVEFNDDGSVRMFMPNPKNRFVIDQFVPNSSGTGGSLKNHNEYRRSWQCDESGIPGSAADCDVTDDSQARLECSVGEDLRINFIPTGTAGQFNTVFDSTTYVRGGEVRGGTMETGQDRNAWERCKAVLELDTTTVPSFLARTTKLN